MSSQPPKAAKAQAKARASAPIAWDDYWGKNVRVQEDAVQLLFWIVFIAATHFVLRKFIFKPLTHYLMGSADSDDKKEVKRGRPTNPSVKALNELKHRDSSGSVSRGGYTLRARGKDGSVVKRETSTRGAASRSRSAAKVPAKQKRTVEKYLVTMWKMVNYGCLAGLGAYALYKEGQDWMWEPAAYFMGWPNQPFPELLRTYYLVGFAHYIYACLTLAYEPKMKDFTEMIIHHIVTMTLVSLSYYIGYFRIGCVVFIVHDVSDPIMELAKLCFYTGYQNMANIVFVIFSTVFVFMRDYILPAHIIYGVLVNGTYNDAGDLIPYRDHFVGFLCVLQCLHIFWTILLGKVLVDAVIKGDVQGDTREMDDE